MYDRTALIAAAQAAGIENASQLATHLGIPRMTAHRLWHGTAEPARRTAAVVADRLGVTEADLLVTTTEAAA